MRIKAFRRADIDRSIAAQARANQVRMHSGCGQNHWYCNVLGINVDIGQEQFGLPRTHCSLGIFADAADRGAQAFLAISDRIGAVDFGGCFSKCGLQPPPFAIGQNRAVEDKDVAILAGFIEDVGKVGKARLQAHHMPLAQAVDRRIGDLAEILSEELADDAWLVRNHGKRGVIPHRADRFLGILNHGAEDHFHILERHTRRHLSPGEVGARPIERCVLALWQVGYAAESVDQRCIFLLRSNPVLEFAITV